jgi:mannose-6-phosphate isomerase-like protein (cupin superfamily)
MEKINAPNLPGRPKKHTTSKRREFRKGNQMLIVNREHARVLHTPHNSEIRPLMDRTTSNIERCSLAEELLPPGAAIGRHYHLETEELYYILDGTGEMSVGAETQTVGGGDCILIPRNEIHTLRNTGNQTMRLLLICGPAYSLADHYEAK